MARLVRDDAWGDEGLKAFAAQILINNGLDSHSDTNSILDALFCFAQKITYINDPGGDFDAIHSARETLQKGYGDCDDLSVLLATLLAGVGFTPAFVLAKYNNDSNGFDHVYLEVETPKGGRVVLDPTTRKHGVGWENSRYIERVVFPIFGVDGARNSLAGAFTALGSIAPLLTTGASIGVNFIPVVGPFLAPFVGIISGMFSKAQQKGEEAARWDGHEAVMQGMTQIQAAVDSCQITAQQGAQAARDLVNQFYAMCDKFTKKSVAKSCRNYATEEGGFDYRTGLIEKAGLNCARAASANGASSAAMVGSNGESGSGGLSVSLPTILLLAGGGYLLMKAFK